jgi:pyruvate kinase
MADLPGPKIRAGQFPDGGVELPPGSTVRLRSGDDHSTAELITVDFPDLDVHVEVGERVVLGDGKITMRVVSKRGDELVAEVESGGRSQGRPGIHLACERLVLHAPTAEDLELADAMAAAGADYIALSFVRRAADIDELRTVVGDRSRIVAKIETAAALEQLVEITDAADAVMVARGDLGIDCPLEDVPHLQKRILRHCVEVGTPVVTATQMLESMIVAPAPTRAEVSDVANAVFDGTDAVMLSAETAIGNDPALVVATMSRIAARAESEASYRHWATRLGRIQQRQASDVRDRITQSITHAAWQAADVVGATAILCCTRSGRTAQSMARFRPPVRLLGLSPVARTLDSLALSWGVEAVEMEESSTTDEMVWFAVEHAVRGGYIAVGDTVIVIAGAPDRLSGAAADVLRIVRVQ